MTAFRPRVRLGVALAAWLATAGNAVAGSFTLAPVRVELDRGRTMGVVTVRNDADAPVTVQAQTLTWAQADGEDRYQPTRELLVTPPVFTIPAKGEQIVRVASRVPPATEREQAWRLVFEEVPEAAPAAANTLRIALRISIPVFGLVPGASDELHFGARRGAHGVELEAENAGRAHVQLIDFELAGPDGRVVARGTGVRYLLPGARLRLPLAVPADVPAGTYRLHGRSDRGDVVAEVALPAR